MESSYLFTMLRHSLLKVPILGTALYNIDVQRRFSKEIALIKGKDISHSNHPSIIHFSVNKAATQYVMRVLASCCQEHQMVHVRFNGYAFHSKFPYLDGLSEKELQEYQYVFRKKGYLYSVFGGTLEGVSDFGEYYAVLVLRDPRDILTSDYYSIAYSHHPPGKDKIDEFMVKRKFARQADVDEYAIFNCQRVKTTFENYLEFYKKNPNVHLAKYETMIQDFESWLDGILNNCKLKISDSLKRKLIDEAVASSKPKENVSKHRRQVTPGDHKRKLSTETIDYLNSSLANVLVGFDYC